MDNAAEILTSKVRQCLGHEPTAEQQQAMNTFSRFMTSGDMQSVMLLRGSAGTGKTTLAAAMVKALTAMGQKIVLMAPTGRAAKVFSLYADHNAFTIHRRIYRQKSAGDLSSFNLNANLQRDTLFIVDEASMIYSSSGTDTFGSGSLMDDLIAFVYQGEGCRLMIIGDQAQLPPVGEELSPALHTDALGAYGLTVYHADLNQVLRQSSTSGILWNATQVRAILEEGMETGDLSLPRFRLHGFADITVVPGDELIESLASSYSRVGTDQTMVITRSNKRANIYNQGIRRTVLDCEDELCRGDRLMIVKNNYHWISVESKTESVESKVESVEFLLPTGRKNSTLYTLHSKLYTPNSKLGFLANGDCCVVQRVRHCHELYGFRFADVTLQLPDYDDYELTATVILDSLKTEAPALTREQQELLYNNVMEDYGDIPLKADRIKKLKEDAHYNALQVKYGYAVTCHKAQGGQWAHVYIDQGYMTDDMLTPDYLHWLYTALTRATEHVFLVNWPAAQVESTVIS